MHSFRAVVHKVKSLGVALDGAVVALERDCTFLGVAAHQNFTLGAIFVKQRLADEKRLVVILPAKRCHGIGLSNAAL